MKTHFGIMENCGSYEQPFNCCEETLCGYTGEIPCENATDDWDCVNCKKCLRLKDAYLKGVEQDEKMIVAQMGDMADWMEKNYKDTDK